VDSKDQLLERVQSAIKLCEPDGSEYSAVMLVVNNESGSVKIFGLNIDELDVPVLLAEAAAEIGGRITDEYENRTLN
jgi:hypothetical protein